MTTDLILHHYALSPYSEKIRAMLGYAGLHWYSAFAPEMPPRPVLDTLTGGYGRIPVAQYGADIYCDTHVISQEIARLSQKPGLDPDQASEAEQAFVKKTESAFFALVMAAGSLSMTWKALKALNPIGLTRLMLDRMEMGRQARVRAPSPLKAGDEARAYLQYVDAHLEQAGTPFLFGDTPRHADFAAYHGLWLIRDVGERGFVRRYRHVMAWMDRIRAFGHGVHTRMGAEKTLDVAREATPAPVSGVADKDAELAGQRVRITPADYRLTPCEGELVGSAENRLIIRRETPRTGVVHVHFPREGYTLTAATR